jgi:hypothetical protein
MLQLLILKTKLQTAKQIYIAFDPFTKEDMRDEVLNRYPCSNPI